MILTASTDPRKASRALIHAALDDLGEHLCPSALADVREETQRIRKPAPQARPGPAQFVEAPPGVRERVIAGVLLLVLMALLALATGCSTSAEARRLAGELRKQLEVNREVSRPKPGVDPVKWGVGQDEAARAAFNIEKEIK